MTPRSLLRTLRSVHSALRTLACRLVGYEVVVVWQDQKREKRTVHVHHALTRAEAREWVDCYARTSGAKARVWAGLCRSYYNPVSR
jgi:hypothetical protein